MDEMWIIKQLAKSIDDSKYPFQICNAFIYSWECDYWTLDRGGMAREFEIKISRADYFNDAKKSKHNQKGANYFYYVCPKGLIKKEEVDKRYGLVYVWETGYIEIVKNPRQLHNEGFKQWAMLALKMYYRYRQIWREKYLSKEITLDQYQEGLALQLQEIENINS